MKLDVAITGGGIGGLAAAVALSRLGHHVTIYEAASELTQIGAGIQVTPNASKQLLRWGAGEYLPDLDGNMPCFKVRRWQDGRIVGRLATETHKDRYGGPYVQVHRADLQQALLKIAERNGVKVHTKSFVADYDFDAPALIFKDGSRVEKDLVIGADGIKSVARQKLSGLDDMPTNSTGLAVYRATLDGAVVAKDPDLAHLIEDPGLNLWVGPGKHAVAYCMRGNSLVNLVLEFKEPRDPADWNESTYVAHIRELFQDWDPKLAKMLGMVTSALKWPLRFSIPLEQWSSKSKKFVLVGDAAHVVPSFLAQGAAMAIEDAATMESLFSGLSSREEVPAALEKFEALRMSRKKRVQELSLHNLHLYHLDDGAEQQARDNPSLDQGDLAPIWSNTTEQKWLYGHDAAAALKA